MFGWEFPPHISGGLGTACYGLTKGLTELRQTDVIFVIPKAFGDEHHKNLQLIGANQIAVSQKAYSFFEANETMELVEVDSPLIPYVSETEFWELKSKRYTSQPRFIQTDEGFKVNFSGKYSGNLISANQSEGFVMLVAKSFGNHKNDFCLFEFCQCFGEAVAGCSQSS